MITGPSGSGKSLLIASIAKFLDVPFVCVDSTTLTEAGYIGQNVDTIISRLVIEANGDVAAAENGIVFLDEIDKIATGKSSSAVPTFTSARDSRQRSACMAASSPSATKSWKATAWEP